MNYWIEKTLVENRPDRISGDRALGKALWSPIKDKRGADIYKNMRKVTKGDIVLHLIDNSRIIGISTVLESAIESSGIAGTSWNGPAYLIELSGYKKVEPAIERNEILNQKFRDKLMKIASNSEVFYNYKLDLRQGAYLTPCSTELLTILDSIYKNKTNVHLPYIQLLDLQNVEEKDLNITKKQSKMELINFHESLWHAGLIFSKNLVSRFFSSLLTKPFVILSGLSGSGKTKLAQAFAMWLCGSDEQYKIVPVGADWTNREPLLGFPNALKENSYINPESGILDLITKASKPENQNKPYFLILDEMNLSHVERYFADFLSTMESEDSILLHAGKDNWNDVPPKITLPKNLFIVGTVNIDETTYMFSPKVLDRANVIEFRVTADEMTTFLSQPSNIYLEAIKSKGSPMEEDFVSMAKNKELAYSKQDDMNEILLGFFKQLKVAGAEFGYRTASEIRRFAAVAEAMGTTWETKEILDIVIMQKLLPKLHGSRRKLEPILKTLISLCLKPDTKLEEYLKLNPEASKEDVLYPISLEKLQRMYRGLIDNGFTSYAEA